MATLEKVYNLDIEKIISGRGLHFFVIGAGGTGGYLIPNLARQISIINNDTGKHKLTIADADDVEVGNLVRQNFIKPDIGKNKATVMAKRYSGAFGIEIGTIDAYIESDTQLNHCLSMYNHTVPVIIGAVDNNKTRQLIYQRFKATKEPIFWLDSGNSEYHAQIVFGYNAGILQKVPEIREKKGVFYMPSVVDLYPDVANDTQTKFISEMSCAERAIHHPQCIATNIIAANILFNMSNVLLNPEQMNGITVGQVIANTKTNGFTYSLNTLDYLMTRYKKPEVPEGTTEPGVPYTHAVVDAIAAG